MKSGPKRLPTQVGSAYLVRGADRARVGDRHRAEALAERLIASPANEAALRAELELGVEASTADLAAQLAAALLAEQAYLFRTRRRTRQLDAPQVVNLTDLVEPEPIVTQTWLSFALVDPEFKPVPGVFELQVGGRSQQGRTEDGKQHERDLHSTDEGELSLSAIELPLRAVASS